MLYSSQKHAVAYRNIGGVTLFVTLSAKGHRSLAFMETGGPRWSQPVTAIARSKLKNAKWETIKRTVDTSAHPGGSGEIDFGFEIDNPGILKQPSPIRLSFFV